MTGLRGWRGAEPLAWCRKMRDLPLSSSAKLVGHMLALHAKPDGSNAHPGVLRLAYETGTSKSTVMRALRELEDAGLLYRTEHGSRSGRGQRASTYQLTTHDDLVWTQTTFDEWLKERGPAGTGVSVKPDWPEQVSG